MAEGIILFGGDNAWTHELNRKRRYYVHGVLLLIAAGFVVTGVSLETNNKIKNNWTHFASVHAIAGELNLKNIRHLGYCIYRFVVDDPGYPFTPVGVRGFQRTDAGQGGAPGLVQVPPQSFRGCGLRCGGGFASLRI